MFGARRLRWRGLQGRASDCFASSKQLLAVSLVLAAVAVSCVLESAKAKPPESRSSPDTGSPVVAHANGLRVVAPDAWRATVTPDGFLIEPVSGNERRRDPLEISIRLLPNPPEAMANRERSLDSGRRVRYSVTRADEGGSGGVDYTLVVVERVGSRWIQYEQRKQSEWGEPRFELWEIANRVSFVAR